MTFRAILLAAAAMLALPQAPAEAQRRPAAAATSWELLGEQTVGFGVDTDRIRIKQDEAWFRDRAFSRLRFAVERNDVNLVSVRVFYINGFSEDLPVNQLIRRGSRLDLDLRGERSFLREIEIRYRSNFGISIGPGGLSVRQAVVKVYGERVAGRPLPPPVPVPPVPPQAGGAWVDIDSQRVGPREDRVILSASRGDGRFARIRLRATDGPVAIDTVRIRFRNGETQRVVLNQRLEPGEETRPIDLEGERRFLDSVTVDVDRRGRPGRPLGLALLGSVRDGGPGAGRPGRDDRFAARGWQFLGEQTIGFGVERDVVNVQQNDDWYRERALRAIHIVAENNDVHLMAVRVVYMNGFSEDLRVDKLLRAGTDHEIDLRGRRSYLRQVELTYRARPGFGGRAVVRVYGEVARP